MVADRLIKKVASFPLTIESWVLSALGIILVRIFLEHYSSNEVGRFVLIDASTIIHYISFFIAVLLFSTFILIFFAKRPLKEASNLALFGFMIIWLPPILDLVISGGSGYTMHYLFLPPKELLYAFLTLFWSTGVDGITFGIRTEIAIVFLGSFGIIYFFTKKIWRALTGSLLLYLGIFILVSLPSVLGLFQSQTTPHFIADSILNSRIINNSSYPEQFGYERVIDIGFNSLMTQVNLVIIFLAAVFICLTGYKDKFKVLLSNSRPERILHYSILILIGTLCGGGPSFYHSWINGLSTIMTVIAFIFAWLVAVCINDIYDKEIDEVSNKNRPIPQSQFSSGEFYSISIVFSLISFVAAYASSMYGLFFVLVFSFAYYIYSAEPLRLKKHWTTGALIIGFASVTALLAGFFLSNQSKSFLDFPPIYTLLLVILFGFGSMIRDIKDYEGDKQQGIKTLPVLVGLKASKAIIATIVSLGFFVIAYYFKDIRLIVSALVASAFVWKIFFSKVYKEKNFFIVYISFLVIFILTFVLR